MAEQLAQRLGDATAALAPLRPLPKPALVAVRTHRRAPRPGPRTRTSMCLALS